MARQVTHRGRAEGLAEILTRHARVRGQGWVAAGDRCLRELTDASPTRIWDRVPKGATEGVVHAAERGEAGGWQEGAGFGEQVCGLSAFLPLSSSVLEPHLRESENRT